MNKKHLKADVIFSCQIRSLPHMGTDNQVESLMGSTDNWSENLKYTGLEDVKISPHAVFTFL